MCSYACACEYVRESEREGENHLCMLRLYLAWAMQIHELPDVLTFGQFGLDRREAVVGNNFDGLERREIRL